MKNIFGYLNFFTFFFFWLFRVAPSAYGSSQARLGVESELQLLIYTSAMATLDL